MLAWIFGFLTVGLACSKHPSPSNAAEVGRRDTINDAVKHGLSSRGNGEGRVAKQQAQESLDSKDFAKM